MDNAELFPGAGAGIAPAPDSVLRPIPAKLFAHRAQRFATLSRNHPLQSFLAFLGELSGVQASLVGISEKAGSWQKSLPDILTAVAKAPLPEPVVRAAEALQRLDVNARQAFAERWLAGKLLADDLAMAPFLAAALQLENTHRAATQDWGDPDEHTGHCPFCGSPPVAATLRSNGALAGIRYLHCGLCATEWHYERLRCAACGSDGAMVYQKAEDYPYPVEAESCNSCKVYLKLFSPGQDSEFDAIADDLATVDLDLHLAESGWSRIAPNPFLMTVA